jgi:hypothetical protein
MPRHAHQRLDRLPQGRAQPAQSPDVRRVAIRHSRSLDPPPGLRAAICREEIVRHGRSGRRDRIDEIHRDNGLADNGEPAASPAAGPES